MLRKTRLYILEILVCTIAVAGYFFAADAELFERFFAFSREHEDWDLDEIVLVYAFASAILPFLLFRANARLRRAKNNARVVKKSAQHAARHDPVTGLYNRRYFNELLDAAISVADPDQIPTILLLDLDRFKAVNDLRGHDCGDRVLQTMAERLLRSGRDGDSVARLGGDEFAILTTDGRNYSDSGSLARRLLIEIGEPIVLDGWDVTVGASIGICHWQVGQDGKTFLRNADQAMYKAKNKGRGRYAYFDKDLGTALQRQAMLETELHSAVAKMQIEPHFQPIIDIKSNRICGFEVLSRWSSPALGPVRPDEFIPLAEDIGLIGAMTWQVMRKALNQASSWDDSLFIAFNLSPRLFDGELLENIKWHLAAARFPAQRIEIEITESAVVDNIAEAKQALDALKDLGIRISLDDFGTGFSSLATLSKLPFDKIKIDKSFVSNVETVPQNAKIVSAILALAMSLDITVTAEGIETENDLRFLSLRDCDQGQGYLFAKPMSARDVTNFLSQTNDLTIEMGHFKAG